MSFQLIALGDMTTAQLMALAGIAILVLTMMRRLMIRSKRRPQPSAPQSHEQISDKIHSRVAIDESAVKLHEMFREMNARAENKTQVLNELLLEADAKIAELKRLIGRAAVPPTPTGREKQRAPEEPLVIDLDAAASAASEEMPATEPGGQAGFAEVYQLADQGLTAAEISERTKHSAGEIDLILALRKVRQRNTIRQT